MFGKASGFAANLDLSTLDGTTGFKLSGAAAYDRSGCSVASAGDVNGDGFDDLIVGARRADPTAAIRRELRGVRQGLGLRRQHRPLDASTAPTASSSAARRQATSSGFSVASAGDVNGDGFDDLIVGASSADPHGSNSGASYVVFGKAAGFAADHRSVGARRHQRLQAQRRGGAATSAAARSPRPATSTATASTT